MSDSALKLAQSKLIILYLLKNMQYPLSNGQISQFALELNYIEYFSLQEYLVELVENDFLLITSENDITRYQITKDGEKALDYFTNHIPKYIRDSTDDYIKRNKRSIKRNFEVTASYKEIDEYEYIVKCSILENSIPLMELKILVGSKEQAKTACRNWKEKTNDFYIKTLNLLLEDSQKNC